MTTYRLPRVLVLLATYNGARWIEEQLASILAQQGVELVVAISDDRSTDDTVGVVRRLAATRNNLAVTVRATPSGSAGANFKGLLAEAALEGFDCVALADQDDVWEPDHLARGCAALQADPAAGGYSCAVRTFGAGEPAVLAQNPGVRPLDFLLEGAGQGCTFVLPLSTARRVQSACRRLGDLTQHFHYHDWMIYLIVRSSGDGWIFDPSPSLRYRQHGANEIGARSGDGAFRRRVDLIRSGWYARQVATALSLASALAPSNTAVNRFRAVFDAAPSLARRAALARLLMREGRRRLSDRIVLGVAALAGWI